MSSWISRSHAAEGRVSEALYSPCERYRYLLTRRWGPGRALLYIMLNPSKATERANDPTIERCERRARALGFGGFRATNIFALRQTDPVEMRRHAAPEGPENDAVLRAGLDWADMVLAAWGTHGAHRGRGPQVEALLRQGRRPVHHLGLSKAGHPKHPLYIAYAQAPERWF